MRSTESPQLEAATFADVATARGRIAEHPAATPLHHSPRLSQLVGTDVWVKHENHQPVGASKVRGGVNFAMAAGDGARELMRASTGNHGQSVANAARRLGLRATVCLPRNPNPVKSAAMPRRAGRQRGQRQRPAAACAARRRSMSRQRPSACRSSRSAAVHGSTGSTSDSHSNASTCALPPARIAASARSTS